VQAIKHCSKVPSLGILSCRVHARPQDMSEPNSHTAPPHSARWSVVYRIMELLNSEPSEDLKSVSLEHCLTLQAQLF